MHPRGPARRRAAAGGDDERDPDDGSGSASALEHGIEIVGVRGVVRLDAEQRGEVGEVNERDESHVPCTDDGWRAPVPLRSRSS